MLFTFRLNIGFKLQNSSYLDISLTKRVGFLKCVSIYRYLKMLIDISISFKSMTALNKTEAFSQNFHADTDTYWLRSILV